MFKLLRTILKKIANTVKSDKGVVIYTTEDTQDTKTFQTGYGDGNINGFGV